MTAQHHTDRMAHGPQSRRLCLVMVWFAVSALLVVASSPPRAFAQLSDDEKSQLRAAYVELRQLTTERRSRTANLELLKGYKDDWSELLNSAEDEPKGQKGRKQRIEVRQNNVRDLEKKIMSEQTKIDGLGKKISKAVNAINRLEKQKAKGLTLPPNKTPKKANKKVVKYPAEQMLGYWRTLNLSRILNVVIKREYPTVDAWKYKLLLHTSNDRVWRGEYEPHNPGDRSRIKNARLTFSYKPRWFEMSRKIPEWARKEVEGKLIWRIELDEAEALNQKEKCVVPKLVGKWFPGVVVYPSGGTRGAKVSEEWGKPYPLKLEFAAPIPKQLPANGKIPPGKVWIQNISDEAKAEASKAHCSCKTVELGYVKTFQVKNDSEIYSVINQYDAWDPTNPPQNGKFLLPELKWRAQSLRYLRPFGQTNRPDRACFYFTFPVELAYYTPEDKLHACNVHVEVKFPRSKNVALVGGSESDWKLVSNYPAGFKLFSVRGSGGSFSGPFGSAGTDGRSLTSNHVCISPVNEHTKIGPAGQKITVEWSVRGSPELPRCEGSPIVEKCKPVEFTLR